MSTRETNIERAKVNPHFFDPSGTLDIDNLSIVVNVRSSMRSNDFPDQLTGTKAAKESIARGTKIFKLH